jgi:hypothetical protein
LEHEITAVRAAVGVVEEKAKDLRRDRKWWAGHDPKRLVGEGARARVGGHDRYQAVAPGGGSGPEMLGPYRIALDRYHPGAAVGARHGQRASAGADVDDEFGRLDLDVIEDATDGVSVDEEVLAEATASVVALAAMLRRPASPGHGRPSVQT